MQDLCLTPDQLKCAQNLEVDLSKCSDKCEGMDVISYNQFETDTKIDRKLSMLLELHKQSGFDKNPKLTRYISKLSDQYDRYKETYNFPTKYKGSINFKKFQISFLNLIHFRTQFCLQTSLCKDKF